MVVRDLGAVAYEGYIKRSKGVSLISGDTLPEWADLKPEIREAWREAANAVIKQYKEEVEEQWDALVTLY